MQTRLPRKIARLLNAAVLLSLIVFQVCVAQKWPPSEKTPDGGRIDYDRDEKTGMLKTARTYDKGGNLVETRQYRDNEVILHTKVFRTGEREVQVDYDDKGVGVEEREYEMFRGDWTLKKRSIYFGNGKEVQFLQDDGKTVYVRSSVFKDSDGKVTKTTTWYDERGSLKWEDEVLFDSSGKVTKAHKYTPGKGWSDFQAPQVQGGSWPPSFDPPKLKPTGEDDPFKVARDLADKDDEEPAKKTSEEEKPSSGKEKPTSDKPSDTEPYDPYLDKQKYLDEFPPSKNKNEKEKPNPEKTPSSVPNPNATKMTTVGLVVPARSSGTVSGTLTTSPGDYQGVPGIQVITASIPLPSDSEGKPSLQNVSLDTGEGQPQSASGPIVFPAGRVKKIKLLPSGDPAMAISLWLTFAPRPLVAMGQNITTFPACSGGSISAVHGPGRFSGDGKKLMVTIGGTRVQPIAANQDGFFYRMPAAIAAGSNRLAFVDWPFEGPFAATAQVAVIKLKAGVAQTALHRGQKTEGNITLEVEGIPPEAWQGDVGMDPDLGDLSQIRKVVPNFEPPRAGQPGTILLAIENRSPQIISIADFKGVVKFYSLTKSSLPFRTRLSIRAENDGGFDIGVIVQPFLSAERCQEFH